MGNVCASPDAAAKRSKEIEREQRKKQDSEEGKVKILLLGAGESGKSTLFKQMKLLYGQTKEFTPQEKLKYKKSVYRNILKDTGALIGALHQRKLKFATPEAKKAENEMKTWRHDIAIGPKEAQVVNAIWRDDVIQQIWHSRSDVQVQDSFEYFMKNIDSISNSNWEPRDQDILRVRVQTTGVVTAPFSMDDTTFEMYDVGGQRTERAKWIHYFDEVTTVLFVAAISEYDQVLFEDAQTNRQAEAVELFGKQLSLENFLNTPFILFLNKNDIFRKKLVEFPFRVDEGPNKRNSDFEGPHIDMKQTYSYLEGKECAKYRECYSAALEYLVKLYVSQAPITRGRTGTIYPHTTNSTDSQNIQKIMTACKDIIIRAHFSDGGFI